MKKRRRMMTKEDREKEFLRQNGLPSPYKFSLSGVWIPNSILNDPNLSFSQSGLLSIICHYGKKCYAPNRFFAKQLRCSRPKISKDIQYLKQLGYITTTTENIQLQEYYEKPTRCIRVWNVVLKSYLEEPLSKPAAIKEYKNA